MNGLVCNDLKFNDLDKELKKPTDKRMFAIAKAIEKGYSIDQIYKLTKVNPWFLYKIRFIKRSETKRFLRSTNSFTNQGLIRRSEK
jgi:carbamoyl-phosphate synthase large subunit